MAQEEYYTRNYEYIDDYYELSQKTDFFADEDVQYSNINVYNTDQRQPCYSFSVKHNSQNANIYDYNSCGTPKISIRQLDAQRSSYNVEDIFSMVSQIDNAQRLYSEQNHRYTTNFEQLINGYDLEINTNIEFSSIQVFEDKSHNNCYAYSLRYKAEGADIYDFNSCREEKLRIRQ